MRKSGSKWIFPSLVGIFSGIHMNSASFRKSDSGTGVFSTVLAVFLLIAVIRSLAACATTLIESVWILTGVILLRS